MQTDEEILASLDAPKKSIPEIDNLAWTDPYQIQTRAGLKLIKSTEPNEQFWELWREHKDLLKEFGLQVSNFQGPWKVTWWARNGEFLYPTLPAIEEATTLVESAPLKLLPLVNEKNILAYQKPLVQQTVAAMTIFGCSLNGCTTGVGKTYITLAAQRERGRRLLVICPKPIIADWQRAAQFMGVTLAGVFNWEWIKTGKTPFGAWEMIETPKTKKKKKGDFIWTLPDDVDICFDEVHRAAAIDTQNAAMVIAAKNAGLNIFMLSATIANDPTKMRATGFVLGLHRDGRDFYTWMARHGVKEQEFRVGNRMIKVYKFVGSARHLQHIYASIFPHKGCRVRAEDLGDQFPKTQIIAKAYDMEEAEEIRDAYYEMMARVDEIMHDKDVASSEKQAIILVEILRARQRVELLKVPLIVSLTRDYEDEGNSVIIAVNFLDTLKTVCEELKIKSIVAGLSSGKQIVPGYGQNSRQDAIDDFQANKVNKIAGIIKAMREGINLHDIHGGHPRVSLISPTPSAFDLKQVLGRPQRAGGKTPSIQRILFAANTIEEEVCQSLATKLDQLDILMDGDLQKGIFPNSYSEMRPVEPDEE